MLVFNYALSVCIVDAVSVSRRARISIGVSRKRLLPRSIGNFLLHLRRPAAWFPRIRSTTSVVPYFRFLRGRSFAGVSATSTGFNPAGVE